MTIRPVQLLVLGFDKPDFQGEIREELSRLRDSDMVTSRRASGRRTSPSTRPSKDGDGRHSTCPLR